jgi:hypothetical protein
MGATHRFAAERSTQANEAYIPVCLDLIELNATIFAVLRLRIAMRLWK